MREGTVTYYQQKIDEVLIYVSNNLGGDLSIKTLAEYSCISHFHFHRLMKAAFNEPLGSYIDRVRIDTAVKLIRYSNETLLEIALKIGYNDLSSFSKAFSKEFGISPSDFKNDNTMILNTHVDYRIDVPGNFIADIKPKVKTVPDKDVIYIRVKGKYGGDETLKAWNEMTAFVRGRNLLGWNPDVFSIYYSDPDEVGDNNCISDICMVTKKDMTLSSRIQKQKVEGGKFASFRYQGPYERLWDVYNYIYKHWLMTTDFKLRDKPIIEKYLTLSEKTKPEDLITEIYLPIH
ncbi:MAG: AraC family transcriptional regulator [bacterium]